MPGLYLNSATTSSFQFISQDSLCPAKIWTHDLPSLTDTASGSENPVFRHITTISGENRYPVRIQYIYSSSMAIALQRKVKAPSSS
jgi:hypothetical protein